MGPTSFWSFTEDAIPHSSTGNNNSQHNTRNTAGNSAYHNFDSLSKKWQYRIRTGEATDYDNDKSRLVAALIRHLLNLNWSPDEILPFLADAKYGSSAHCRSQPGDPYQTGRRQIERVIALMNANFKVNRNGVILDSDPHNIALACHKMGIEFRYNEFDKRIYTYNGSEHIATEDGELEVIALEIYKQFQFWPQQRALWRFVEGSSREHQYHPVREHLQYLQTRWEQKQQSPHLTEQWLIHLAGAPDTPLVRAQSQLIAVAAVRRIRDPGCKFDEMLVLQGVEGTNKSSALERLAIQPEYFSDNFPLHERSSQRVQERLRGKWIVECSELAGYDQANSEHFKSMLSRSNDSVRQAYGRLPVDSRRQCVFFGSTNEQHFLMDNSNRRVWPIPVQNFDLDALDAVLNDFWGEAAHLESTGMSIRLDPSLWPDASEQQQLFRLKDPWTDELQTKLISTDGEELEGFITAPDAFKLLGSNMAAMRVPNANRRLMQAMIDKDLGFAHKRKRIKGRLLNGFVRGNEDLMIYAFIDDINMKTYKASNTPDAGDDDVPDF